MSKAAKRQITVVIMPPISEEKKRGLELKLDKARYYIMRKSCFYGMLLMNLTDSISSCVPTVETNGRKIFWNPYFLDKMSDKEVRYILLHETNHCAYGHLWRFPPLIDKDGNKRRNRKGNIACDHVINLNLNVVVDSDNNKLDIEMPERGLADKKFSGLAEEEVHRLLPDDQDGYGEDGDPTGGFFISDDGEESGRRKNGSNLKDEWERNLIAAAQVAKSTNQGNLPGDLQRILDDRLAQRVNWKIEMADFVKTCFSERNDWTRSSRRHAWLPIIMPRKKKNLISKVVFVRDTSGSVGDNELSLFTGLIEQCIGETGSFGYIFDVDAALNYEYEIGPGIEVPKTAHGGGGTDFRPAFKRCQELIDNGEEIAGLIYITDLMGDFPSAPPEFPTLWLSITEKSVAPFGRTIFVN